MLSRKPYRFVILPPGGSEDPGEVWVDFEPNDFGEDDWQDIEDVFAEEEASEYVDCFIFKYVAPYDTPSKVRDRLTSLGFVWDQVTQDPGVVFDSPASQLQKPSRKAKGPGL